METRRHGCDAARRWMPVVVTVIQGLGFAKMEEVVVDEEDNYYDFVDDNNHKPVVIGDVDDVDVAFPSCLLGLPTPFSVAAVITSTATRTSFLV